MNAISISNVAIRQTSNNLYNLNDLHRASGGLDKYKPANWLRLQQTDELVKEMGDAQNRASKENQEVIQVIKGGKNQGTFACKELVYAYATWISAKFFLLVIRTFDAVVSGSLKSPAAKTTADERTPLRQAVSALVGLRGVDYSSAYNMVHQRFGVAAIEELPREKLPDAVQYVHTLTLGGLQGEILDKPQPEAEPFTADEIRAFEVCVKYLHDSMAFLRCLYRPLRDVNSPMAGRAFSLSQEPHSWLNTAQNALQRHRILSRPL